MLCFTCRSFGVQVSKVRSLTLDDLDSEHVRIMCSLGNAAVNRIYEARVVELGATKPESSCGRCERRARHRTQFGHCGVYIFSAAREQWIRRKYVDKEFVPLLLQSEDDSAKR